MSKALTGLMPGTTYHFRAKGVNTVGPGYGADLTFTTLSQVEAWWRSWFGTTANTGNAADSADPNNNGIINILGHALNGNPIGNTTGTGILPLASINTVSNCLQLAFTRHLDRNNITLTVQANDAVTGTWTDLAQSVNGGAFTVLAAGTAVDETGAGNTRTVTIGDLYQVTDPAHPRRFLRLQVTSP